MNAFWTKKGTMMPVARGITDFVEDNISTIQNQFMTLDRTDKTGFGLYEYHTEDTSCTHHITDDKVIRQFKLNGVEKHSRGNKSW